MGRHLATLLISLAALLPLAPALRAAEPPRDRVLAPAATDSDNFEVVSLRGRVVWLAEALKRLHGIESDDDASQLQIALETPTGELWPIVKDPRGRGFWLDERIRGLDMELLVRRYHGVPYLKIIRVYTLKPEGRFELDYWCDICAIPMYELKPCECCQGETRLRERPAPETPD